MPRIRVPYSDVTVRRSRNDVNLALGMRVVIILHTVHFWSMIHLSLKPEVNRQARMIVYVSRRWIHLTCFYFQQNFIKWKLVLKNKLKLVSKSASTPTLKLGSSAKNFKIGTNTWTTIKFFVSASYKLQSGKIFGFQHTKKVSLQKSFWFSKSSKRI